MPTLTWIGKDKVINHHHDVPFRILDPQYSYGTPSPDLGEGRAEGNRIIHGDNLEALKALLPYYEGRIKCIYIDPPYNTGNEGWVYNDNVSDPKLKRWLGKVVGKESEDLSRHDKWLCMMYPRLQLLHRLLADDGAIFVSIDDNEQASLKLVMDEIWGPGNFVSSIVWQKNFAPKNDAKHFSTDTESIIAYAKSLTLLKIYRLKRSEKNLQNYKNPDNDIRGLWASSDLLRMEHRDNSVYTITSPSGRQWAPEPGTSWRHPEPELIELVKNNRIWFGLDGNTKPRRKRFLSEIKEGVIPQTLWKHEEVGNTQEAKKEVNSIFKGTNERFPTPKPTRLIERILQIATGPNDIILDSFAGSGTTAHAVLNLNKQDGGNRQFILVEMEDYAETITAERVRRVIDGYGGKDGTGGEFTYYELGPALFTENGLLNEDLPLNRIREYIWYSETRLPFLSTPKTENETPHFLGKLFETAYYFYYQPNELTTLDYDFLSTVQTPAEQYVIYADNCLISPDWLQQRHIIFKKIPRDISRF
ncbi:site-specific DNA-methyltransferase [Spirosoma pollinicola]|uniref:site-specific DNA-methyltransferase (adenine-specific) n=1 Tax=Spirosoma pollinicola TaxID=2057025 RepID=A0A2K8Z7J3_9BACT|nr:site-specific DNA-methyltransferase [Spirosoma pollinicola]AUD05845.1 type III restriction endonuclease subunit M [Spirosoma pollinicola]